MVATTSPAARSRPHTSLRLEPRIAWIWGLTLVLVLYLGLDGGGFDLVVRSRAGIVIWWAVLLGAALGLIPSSRVGRAAWVTLLLFALFAAWSTLSVTWSLSSEHGLDEASRLVTYLGVLGLAIGTFGDRRRALVHTVGALGTGVFIIATLALLARIQPGFVPAAVRSANTFPDARARISWPLNYWNALGALLAFGLPLLLSLATSARTMVARGAAAAALPVLIVCGYLTYSRGSAIAAGVAVVVFLALSPQRIPRVLTALLCGAGGVALIAAAIHRHAIANGVSSSVAKHQGNSLLVLIVVVCVVAGLLQVLLTLGARRVVPETLRRVPLRAARPLAVVALILVVIVAVALGAPHRLDHAWQSFKRPTGAHLSHDNLARFTALSGNGRYTYWKTAIDALPGHVLDGFGLGSFQLVWLPRAPILSYVQNAHSLYVETLTEVGLPGLVLLLGWLVGVFVTACRRLRDADPLARCLAAAAVAATVSFAVSAAFDWIWQVPVLPVSLILLVAAVLTPTASSAPDVAPAEGTRARGRRRLAMQVPLRGAAVMLSMGCLALIGVPMAMTQALSRSQTAVDSGNLSAALTDARTATNLEPGAESPAVQAALVLELQGRFAAATSYARTATSNEPQNWDAWLVRSRLEAEAGHARVSLEAYRRARALNPRSPIFQS